MREVTLFLKITKQIQTNLDAEELVEALWDDHVDFLSASDLKSAELIDVDLGTAGWIPSEDIEEYGVSEEEL